MYFCIVLCIVSPFVYSRLLPIFVPVYPPLPPGGNPVLVNKYRIVSYHIILSSAQIVRDENARQNLED